MLIQGGHQHISRQHHRRCCQLLEVIVVGIACILQQPVVVAVYFTPLLHRRCIQVAHEHLAFQMHLYEYNTAAIVP